MSISNEQFMSRGDGVYQYLGNGDHIKIKVYVEFAGSPDDKEIAEEVTAILKKNYLEKIQSALCLEQEEEGE